MPSGELIERDCGAEVSSTNGDVPSDAQLVEEARRGDQNAFKQIVLRYERRLSRTIYHLVWDRELAEDLTQETFLRAFSRLGQIDPSRRLGPWLFRIGVNLTIDHLRKQKRRRRWFQFSQTAEGTVRGPSVPDSRPQRDLQQEVRAVINEIPEKYRQVLILRDLEYLSAYEIAAILGRKVGTIRWRLSEARTRFADLWMKRQAGQNASAV